MQTHILQNCLGKYSLILLFATLATLGIAQKPNNAYRLPVTPDMPDWATLLYRDDIEVNVFELDEAFEEWEEAYEAEHEAEEAEAKAKDEHMENKWEAYYNRWRKAVRNYVQPDGTLLFEEAPSLKPKPQNDMTRSSSSTWSLLGPKFTYWAVNDNPAQPPSPWQANIYTLAVAPSDHNTLLYGSETGFVGKSTDKGLNWTAVGLDYFSNTVDGAAIHPTNTDIFYMGDNTGVHTSTDGGATWSQALTIGSFNCNDIKIKADDPEVVLAAGSSLQRRTAGNTWTTILSETTYDIAFKPDDPSIVYVLVKNTGLNLCEFWKSTDGGQTFSIRSTGWITGLTNGGGRLTVTPADNDRIYAILLTGNGPRMMRSDDAGETWTIQASSTYTGLAGPCLTGPFSMTNGQGYYDLSVAASHTDADQLIVGTTTSFKSTDGGTTYAPLGGYCGPFSPHPDIQEMVAMGGDVWIATDGGINLSTDFFTSDHQVRITNMGGTDFWGFDQGWNEDVQVGGRYHNGNTAHRESYPAGEFLRMGGAEQPTGYLNPGNAGMAYFSDLSGGGRMLPTTINSLYGTFTVTKFPNESFYPLEYSEQVWDPRYSYTYYLGNSNSLWKTTDNGLSFTALFTHAIGSAKVQAIEVSRTDPSTIYCTVQLSGDGELWNTTDGGATWTQCANPAGPTSANRRVSSISLSGTDPLTLWWSFRNSSDGNRIFKSTDGGATWTNLTTSTLDGVGIPDMIHQLGTDGGIYLACSNSKVYYRNNSHADWNEYDTGLPYKINPLMRMKPYYKGGKLRMSTNKGIWEVDLYEPSTTTLVQPMAETAIPGCSRDTIQLESYSVVNGAATYQWAITPAPQWIDNANIRNPRVLLGTTPQSYSATLTVTDDNGVTNRTINNLIDHLSAGNLCANDTIPGNALSVDGNGDYAEANAPLNLNTNTATITAWIKRDGQQNNFDGIIMARGGNTAAGISINSDNKLRFFWNATGWQNTPAQVVPDNEWAHIALVITPTNAILYVNGVGTTINITNAAEQFDVPLRMGHDPFSPNTRFFKGLIDEVTVWNTALTRDQIRELMHLTVVPSGQTGLVSYYQFNEPSGLAIYDKVDLIHATLIGDATRTVSTGPFGGGTSNRQTVTTGGAMAFPGTDVTLGFPASGTYPDGEVVVTRLNVAADSLPPGFDYTAENNSWVIDNYGTNPTFTALDSMRLGNFLVPGVHAISPTSYQLTRRSANAHQLPWTVLPSTSIGATGGASGRITFGNASGITQFGQFLPVNVETCPINLAVDDVPIIDGTYNADQEITSLGTVPGNGDVTFQAETVELQPDFEVLLGGVFTVFLLSCFP